MKLSAPVSSIFLLQPCPAYRHNLDETGLFIPGVGLNQHRLRTSAWRTILKTRHKIPCQKSQVGRAERKKAPETSSHHWTGDSGVDGRQPKPKPEAQPRPLPCWFEPTCSGACARLRC